MIRRFYETMDGAVDHVKSESGFSNAACHGQLRHGRILQGRADEKRNASGSKQ
jgi:hypothetical protein